MKSKGLTAVEKENIAMLKAQGMTPNRIGGIVGRDPKTVTAALAKPEVALQVVSYQERITAKYEQLAERMVDSITDDDIGKINAYQRIVAAGISTDKARLISGQSNVNIALLFSQAMESPLYGEE